MKYIKLADIKKLENNPRTIKKEDFDKLTDSIKKFGVLEGRPFLISNRTGENIIIGGNQRYEVCSKLGIKEVPVHIMEGLTEEEEREIIIRDNISNGEWDMEILANEWNTEELKEWGVGLPNFEDIDYSLLDGENDEKLDAMRDGVKKAIQVEFSLEEYDEAYEMFKFWREKGMDLGGFIMGKLKEEKIKL